jgi:hypothetical protein
MQCETAAAGQDAFLAERSRSISLYVWRRRPFPGTRLDVSSGFEVKPRKKK